MIPTIVKLKSGLRLVSYRPGHSCLFRIGNHVRITDADIVEIQTQQDNFQAALLTKDNWVDIT
ncbi:MAG: hypothetical protein AABX52_00010 [Nanoarchaeota archaeon]